MPSGFTGSVAPSAGESGPNGGSPGSAEALAGRQMSSSSETSVDARAVVIAAAL
jgi:hypothetical protein